MSNFYVEYMSQLLRRKNLNFQFIPIISDGNCLFRAISDQIYGDQDFHSEIRQTAYLYLLDRKEDFEPFIEQNGQTFDHYKTFLEKIQKDGTWGGDECLIALATCFQAKIIVHTLSECFEFKGCDENTKEFHLFFNNNHYSSLRLQPEQDNDEDQADGEEFMLNDDQATVRF